MSIASSSISRLLAIPVTAGLLTILPMQCSPWIEIGPEIEARRQAVAAAVEAMDPIVGTRWVASDVEVPVEAMDLLRPNAIVSRSYRDLTTSRAFQFVLVHATEMNDLMGHYPPVCYPNAGWIVSRPATDATISVLGRDVPIRSYHFSRPGENGVGDTGIRVSNAFILPNGQLTRDEADLRQRAERRLYAEAGMAQLQIVGPIEYEETAQLEALSEILQGAPEVLDALGFHADSANAADSEPPARTDAKTQIEIERTTASQRGAGEEQHRGI